MRSPRIALTGPCAAALHGLDGFRDQIWPELWCGPSRTQPDQRVVRTRRWAPPGLVDDLPVCDVDMVLRHLNAVPTDLVGRNDGLFPIDRVELATEHVLRLGWTVRAVKGSRSPGDRMLADVLKRRGGAPPTESYAETRAVQLFRSWGIAAWRQIPVRENGVTRFRADFMIPFSRKCRPEVIRAVDGVLVEVDSREFHADQFEHDSSRANLYDRHGYHWVSITPNQIERRPAAVLQAIAGAFRRSGHTLPVVASRPDRTKPPSRSDRPSLALRSAE